MFDALEGIQTAALRIDWALDNRMLYKHGHNVVHYIEQLCQMKTPFG